jgi:hypothetical protein
MRHEWRTPGGTFFSIDSAQLGDRGPLGDEILRLAAKVQELEEANAKAYARGFADGKAASHEAALRAELARRDRRDNPLAKLAPGDF